MESLDPSALGTGGNYFLMTSLLVPRPIAWLGTRRCGIDNLAPFSYFMGVSSDPPLVAVSVARGRGGALKDSARNLLETEQGTLSLVSADRIEAMHRSSAPFSSEVSEFDACGLTREPASLVDACYVSGSRAVMEVRLHSAQDLGSTHLFLLRVVCYQVQEGLLRDGRVAVEDLDPVARLCGDYALLGERRKLPPAKVD